jgi:hypothetical protein
MTLVAANGCIWLITRRHCHCRPLDGQLSLKGLRENFYITMAYFLPSPSLTVLKLAPLSRACFFCTVMLHRVNRCHRRVIEFINADDTF